MKGKILIASLCVLFGMHAAGCASRQTAQEEASVSEEFVLPETGEGEAEQGLPQVPTEEETPAETPQETPEETSQEKPQEQTPPKTTQPDTPPVVQTDTLVRATTNGVNVRSGAGTGYAVLGTLDATDMAMPTRTVGNWQEILFRGGVGYVSSAYMRKVSFAKGSETVERVIDEGKKLLGIPYVFGAARYHWGNGVRNANFSINSFDCSSLMQYIFKKGANVDLAMTSREQSVQGKKVARADIRRGDLLFFTNASRVNKTGVERIGHVALYLGDNIILHTASDHAVIEPISAQRSAYFITARRVL